jgi:hypothetical protein
MVQAAHDADRPFERAHDLADRDLGRVPRQHVSALGTVLADDEPPLRQTLAGSSRAARADMPNSSAIRFALTAPRPSCVAM